MAKQERSKKRSPGPSPTRQGGSSAATPRKEQSKSRRVFTVIICVVVALGLMLPVTGLGVASCSAQKSSSQDAQGDESND